MRVLMFLKKALKKIGWFLFPFAVVSVLLGITTFFLWMGENADYETEHERFENLGVVVNLSEKDYFGDCQPTIMLVGGSEGGFWGDFDNNYSRVEELNDLGFHVIKVAYRKIEGLADKFDRIEIEPFTRVIEEFSKKYPEIDPNCVAVIGTSRGSELILNVASRSDQFKAVVAMVPPSVTFQGKEIGSNKNATASYQFDGTELPYVPLASGSFLGTETIWSGEINLFSSAMLNKSAVDAARIPVENITAPLLLISGKYDHIWPSYVMAEDIVQRLKQYNFTYKVEHIGLDANHYIDDNDIAWEEIIKFLKEEL